MKLVVGSNRQLPIRYIPNQGLWVKRGILCPKEITLPFFVEVEIMQDFEVFHQYLVAFSDQYNAFKIQLFVEDHSLKHFIKSKYPQAIVCENLIAFSNH